MGFVSVSDEVHPDLAAKIAQCGLDEATFFTGLCDPLDNAKVEACQFLQFVDKGATAIGGMAAGHAQPLPFGLRDQRRDCPETESPHKSAGLCGFVFAWKIAASGRCVTRGSLRCTASHISADWRGKLHHCMAGLATEVAREDRERLERLRITNEV